MTSILEELNREIENLALEMVMLDADDISGLGKAIKSIEFILELSKPLKESALTSVMEAIKRCVEEAIMGKKGFRAFRKRYFHVAGNGQGYCQREKN